MLMIKRINMCTTLETCFANPTWLAQSNQSEDGKMLMSFRAHNLIGWTNGLIVFGVFSDSGQLEMFWGLGRIRFTWQPIEAEMWLDEKSTPTLTTWKHCREDHLYSIFSCALTPKPLIMSVGINLVHAGSRAGESSWKCGRQFLYPPPSQPALNFFERSRRDGRH